MIIANRRFSINSPLERIEQLVMKAVIEALQPERLEASDEKSFQAMVKAKMGPLNLPMHMAGEIISPSNPLEFMIKLKGQGGLIWLNQKATFTLTSLDKDKTEVACELVAVGMAPLLRIFLLWKVKSFAADILGGFENQLRQWA